MHNATLHITHKINGCVSEIFQYLQERKMKVGNVLKGNKNKIGNDNNVL